MMFEEFGPIGNALILLASLIALDKASDWAINNSIKVADITGLGKTTIGFILVAFSTSLPELSVAVFAAIGQESMGVAIGNVLGSNIANVCLILGICFLMISLKMDKDVLLPTIAKEDLSSLYFGLFIASIVPLTLLYLGYASRFIGVILIAIFVFYIYQLSKVKTVKEEGALGEERRKLARYVALTILGATGVVASAYFIVESATYIAYYVNVPKVIIGATIVAFGTSLPELATSVEAVKRGHLNMALGNIVGSAFINITLILGVSLVASPLRIDMAAFSDLAIFSLITNLILWYFLSSERISWREGAVLLFLYFLFLAISFGGYKA
ncbi:MAG: sodium:calcium antiporter [Candidatus Bathyarchaeia archaeon]